MRGGACEHRREGWGGGAWGPGTKGRPSGSTEGRRLRSGETGEWRRGAGEPRLSRPSPPGVKCRDPRMPSQPGKCKSAGGCGFREANPASPLSGTFSSAAVCLCVCVK